jgi:ribosomal RNA-processing protein 7
LKEKVDLAMELFDQEDSKKKMIEKSIQNQTDQDGFTLVGKSTKKTNTDQFGGSVQSIKKEEAEKLKTKTKTKGLVDFYRFQKREQKRKELVDLRLKFEQDKKKVEQMKNDRRFRPY